MRSLLLLTVAAVVVVLATAAVVPKEFRSSHGHKKYTKEAEREETLEESTHAPVKHHVTKAPAAVHRHQEEGPQPVIHPIPSHPPPHAEDGEAHRKPQVSGPTPVIHPIASHPPPAEPTKPTEKISTKESEKEE